VFEELRSRGLESKRFWNVNLPHGSGEASGSHVYCSPCRNPLRVQYELTGGDYHYSGVYADREGEAQSDVTRCFGGDIAISKIAL
jgi:5'-nucleotidase